MKQSDEQYTGKVVPIDSDVLTPPQRESLARLHAQATGVASRGASCVVENTAQFYESAVRKVVAGWSLVLSLHVHVGIECWHLSAKLDPLGRGSTETDWQVLGAIVAAITGLSGHPRTSSMPEAMPPIDGPNPNRAFHWSWHADGSPVLESYLATMREFLALPDATVESAGRRAAAVLPKPSRNDPCPCGSGKKFKRCHGAPSVGQN